MAKRIEPLRLATLNLSFGVNVISVSALVAGCMEERGKSVKMRTKSIANVSLPRESI